MAKKRGAPPKPVDKCKSKPTQVRLEPAEKIAFVAAADLAGVSLSSWMRERLRSAARKELEGAGQAVPFLE